VIPNNPSIAGEGKAGKLIDLSKEANPFSNPIKKLEHLDKTTVLTPS
jgi:hypothetical protein